MASKLNMIASLYEKMRPKKPKREPAEEGSSQADQVSKSIKDATGGESTRPDPLKKKK